MWIKNTFQYTICFIKVNRKMQIDKQGFAETLLMDLSKAFDTINHELLIARLRAHGFSPDGLKVLLRYLQDRRQRVKINTTFSSWTLLLQGVPKNPGVPCSKPLASKSTQPFILPRSIK